MNFRIMVMALAATAVSAQNVSWNVTDGDLSVPSNWSGGTLPGDTDTVVFGQQGASTLTTSAWLTNAAALFNAGAGGGAVTLNLAGYGLHLTNTLTFNLPTIKKIRILIGGKERESLKGHIGLNNPFMMNRELIAPAALPKEQ